MKIHCRQSAVSFSPKSWRIVLGLASSRRLAVAVLFGMIVIVLVPDARAQPAPAAVYSETQAENGRALYTRSCAICHRTDLQGNFEGNWLPGSGCLT